MLKQQFCFFILEVGIEDDHFELSSTDELKDSEKKLLLGRLLRYSTAKTIVPRPKRRQLKMAKTNAQLE